MLLPVLTVKTKRNNNKKSCDFIQEKVRKKSVILKIRKKVRKKVRKKIRKKVSKKNT